MIVTLESNIIVTLQSNTLYIVTLESNIIVTLQSNTLLLEFFFKINNSFIFEKMNTALLSKVTFQFPWGKGDTYVLVGNWYSDHTALA